MDAPTELASFPDLPGFRLIQELGRSPKGVIYKARRLVEQDIVAIKLFREPFVKDNAFREGLERNAESTFLLEHPALVRCLGCLECNGRLLLVMEYAKGEPLSRALQRNVRFLPPRALNIAIQLADALHYAYQRRRFHGRIHPGDAILSEEEVRLLGVGLDERPEHPAWNVKDPHLFEPLIYSAPETMPSLPFPESDEARRAADLYALGGLLYHMLTGFPPFRGADEGAINQERQSYRPAAMRWPRGADKTLPSRAILVCEKMLAQNPSERGVYESILANLDEALREAEGRPLSAPLPQAAPPPLAPAEIARRAEPEAPPVVHAQAMPASFTPASAIRPSALPPPRRPGLPSRYPDDRRSERISTALLIGATCIVFASAMALAAKVFLSSPETPSQAAQPAAQPAPAPVAVPHVEKPAAEELSREAEAARRLETYKDLRGRGIAKDNLASLKILQGIAEQARQDSPTRMEAELLKAEVEEAMARAGLRPAPASLPAGSGDAEEKVFQEMLATAKRLAEQQRFGDAARSLTELPPPLKNLAPYPEKAREEIARLEQDAKARFAEVSLEADRARAGGDYAKARGLYQTVQARFGIPEWVEAAQEKVKAINEAEEKFRDAQARKAAEEAKVRELGKLAEVARGAALKAGEFRYAEAMADLELFAKDAVDREVQGLAKDYAKVLQDEDWFFKRSRARLKEAIQRDPKGASPLAGYNDKGELLFEITDFDEKGITFVTQRGGASGERIREWKTINPSQHLETMKGVMDKESAQEQLGLAAMAWHRHAVAELQARGAHPVPETATPKGEKAPLYDPAQLARTMKSALGDALNAAGRDGGAARERAETQRKTCENLLLVILAQGMGQ